MWRPLRNAVSCWSLKHLIQILLKISPSSLHLPISTYFREQPARRTSLQQHQLFPSSPFSYIGGTSSAPCLPVWYLWNHQDGAGRAQDAGWIALSCSMTSPVAGFPPLASDPLQPWNLPTPGCWCPRAAGMVLYVAWAPPCTLTGVRGVPFPV